MLLAILLALWLNLLLVFSDPTVQKWVSRYTAAYLSQKTGTTIKISKIRLGIKLQLVIEDLVVDDLHQNTLLSVNEMEFVPDAFHLLKALRIQMVHLKKPSFNIVRYENEADFNYQFLLDAFAGSPQEASSKQKGYPIEVERLSISDGHFSYLIQGKDTVPDRMMDYNKLIINNIHLDAQQIHFNGDSLTAVINALSAVERSGLQLDKLSTELTIGDDFVNTRNLKIMARESALDLDLKMQFRGLGSFDYFIDSVMLVADVRPSRLQMADLGCFSESLYDMPNLLFFQGRATGTVADFTAKGFKLSYGEHTFVEADLSMRGLPDIYTTHLSANVRSFTTRVSDIESFRLPIEESQIKLPSKMENLGRLSMRGIFDGTYRDFITRLNINTSLGFVEANLVLRTNPLNDRTSYKAIVGTRQFNLGRLLANTDVPGKTTMLFNIEGSGLNAHDALMDIQGNIGFIEMPGAVFSGIELDGRFEEMNLTAHAHIHDPKLAFKLSGTADFNTAKPLYSIDLKLVHADLAAMGLVDTDSIFDLSTRLSGQFSLTGEQDFIGLLAFRDTHLTNSNGQLVITNIQISALEDPFLERKLLLQSDILQVEFGGKFLFSQLGASLSNFLHHYFAIETLQPDFKDLAGQDFYYNLRVKDLSGISRMFMPGFMVSRNTSFTGVYMSITNTWQSTFYADTLALGSLTLHKPYILLNGAMDKLKLSLRSTELELYRSIDPGTPSLGLEDANLILEAARDSLHIGFKWQNTGQRINKGNLKALLTATNPAMAQFKVLDSDIRVNDSLLWFNNLGRIILGTNRSVVENFSVHLGNSSILINGSLPQTETDTLSLSFKQWEISNANFLLAPYGVSASGSINGDLTLVNLGAYPAFFSNLTIQKLRLNNDNLGDARLMSTWSGAGNSIYVNAQIINRGNVGSSRIFHLRGFYFPGRSEENISFNLQLENFRLKVLSSFLDGYVSGIDGFANGSLDIGGSINQPKLTGSLGLFRTSFLIDYLNVRYSLQHEFQIESNEIVIRNLMLIDTANNKATVNGTISHKHLRDFVIDLRLRPDNLIALNTGPSQNSLFYGTAVVSGEVIIRGPFENLELGIRVISQRGTSMVIPIDLSTSVGTSDYISFVKQFNMGVVSDLSKKQRNVASANFGINLETVITPDANLRIFMPYNTGTLDARGNGNLAMGVNNAGEFTLNGEYMLQSGQFNFTYENLIKRRFDLIEGGRITWAGDPYDASIDAKGVYRVKASLAGLGLDTTQSLSNRVNVDCIIHLSNNLFNPDIRFGFRFPNLDSQIEQSIFTVIDTTNNAMMTQQMISLLVLGSFASSNRMDNFSLGNSSLDVISGQLSSWLSQISKDFDIGLYYRPGDQISSNELEVALSTQLFNERVTIDGNFGMVNNRNTAQNASNLVGDVEINVKLTRDGRLRLRGYNHSNVNNWISASAFERYAPYTQGVGLSFRQEFDRFSEIFRRKRKPKNNPL